MTGRIGASFTVAALFGLHPAHVESVAWITERKDVLSMLMLVCSLIAYWRYTVSSKWMAYLASLLLFSLSLMSKAMMVTEPALLMLLDIWPLSRNACNPTIPLRRLVLEKLPFVLLAVATAVITLMTQSMQGASPDLRQLSIADRIGTVLTGYVRYLRIAFWPTDLSAYYPYQFNIPIAWVVASAALLALISAVARKLRKRRPYLLVGWLWYLLTLLPVIGIVQVGNQSMADRFSYLPFVGVSIAVVWTIADLIERHPIARVPAIVFGCVVAISLAISARLYLPCWHDSISLFTQAAAANGSPDWNIEYHLAEGYRQSGQLDQAIDHYERALQSNPNHLSSHINLANLLMPHFPQLALPHYQKAIQIAPRNAIAQENYGLCLQALKQRSTAEAELDRARRLR